MELLPFRQFEDRLYIVSIFDAMSDQELSLDQKQIIESFLEKRAETEGQRFWRVVAGFVITNLVVLATGYFVATKELMSAIELRESAIIAKYDDLESNVVTRLVKADLKSEEVDEKLGTLLHSLKEQEKEYSVRLGEVAGLNQRLQNQRAEIEDQQRTLGGVNSELEMLLKNIDAYGQDDDLLGQIRALSSLIAEDENLGRLAILQETTDEVQEEFDKLQLAVDGLAGSALKHFYAEGDSVVVRDPKPGSGNVLDVQRGGSHAYVSIGTKADNAPFVRALPGGNGKLAGLLLGAGRRDNMAELHSNGKIFLRGHIHLNGRLISSPENP